MEQSISAGLARIGKHIELARQMTGILQRYLKSINDSSYEMLEKMLSEYVSNPWYTPDTSELKQYLQAVSADVRFELSKKKYGWSNYTALHEAAERGDTEVMRCLLELVEPQKRYELLKIQGEWWGGTPLHAAASIGRTEIMRCMLRMVKPENQIQLLDIPNKSNKTALDVAKGEETVQLIRQYRESAVREITDDYDRVQCAFCRGDLHRWEAEDNPMTEHAKAFPFCRFVKGVECADKEYKNDLLLADELKNITPFTMPAMYEVQPGRMDTADSGPPSASCKTCYKKTSQVVQASQVGQPCDHLIYHDKCIQDEKLKMDRSNGYKCRCYDRMKTDSTSIPPGSNINTYKAGLHGHLQTTSLVPDNLKWIFNPSLHGISSAVSSPPSYLTDVLCYVDGYHGNGAAVPDQLPMPLQQELAAMSPQEYRAAVRNVLSTIQLLWLMCMEMQRRRTFLDDWPHSGNLSGEQMARAGFYHSGGYDSVRCVFCGVVIENWDVGDDAITEHKRWSAGCIFMAGWDCTIMGQQPSEDALPQQETAR